MDGGREGCKLSDLAVMLADRLHNSDIVWTFPYLYIQTLKITKISAVHMPYDMVHKNSQISVYCPNLYACKQFLALCPVN